MLAALAKKLPWGPRKLAAFLAFYRGRLIWSHPQFAGVYSSFSELPQFPDHVVAGHAQTNAATPKIDNATGLPILQQDHSLLPMVAAMLGSPLRVLDFGGGAGIDFGNLTRCADVAPDYTVVELPALCEAGNRIWKDSRIRFVSELPERGDFDLIYSWGAIQLHPEPFSVLKRFASYAPKAILLAHIPMTEGASFVRGQVRQCVTFPAWVLSIPEIARTMAECGYRIAAQSSTFDDYNVDGYEKQFHVPHCTSMLLLPYLPR